MNKLPHFNAYLFSKVIQFEWILLIICIMVQALMLWKRGYNPEASVPDLRVSLMFLSAVGALSFAKPYNGNYFDRICYLLLELMMMTAATATGIPRFLFPIFVVVIAKACLLLDRKGLFLISICYMISQFAYASFKTHIDPRTAANPGGAIAIIFVFVYVAIVLAVLVAMLCLSLLAEQDSRLKTERLSQEVQHLATELERTRIAREIHDTLGHTLTSLNIQLDIARKLQDRDPDKATEALELAKQLASQSLTDVRMAVQSIRDHDDFNFHRAVSSLVTDVRQNQQNMDVQLKIDIQELPPSVGFQLFRVIQECLTNVLKHANASEVKIELDQVQETLCLNVSDNGRGMDACETPRTGGFGIRGMQERIESMNGTVAITAQPNKGTNINVSIPLKSETA